MSHKTTSHIITDSVKHSEMLIIRIHAIVFCLVYIYAKSFEYFKFYLCRLKLECEKLATEKTEMQRHYVMVS